MSAPRRSATKKAPAKKTAAAKKPARKKTPPKPTPRKATAPAKKPTARKPPAKKAAAKKAPAKKATPRRKKSEPLQPNVAEVVDHLREGQKELEDTPPLPPGPIENACRAELEAMQLDATALGASAVALARMADQSTGATSVATALREMRMTLGAARGLGRPANPVPTGGPNGEGEGVVVQETRLEKLRREREQGRGHR